jgi:23S rRNA (guanosine2251-2'-O)-methyltransferase
MWIFGKRPVLEILKEGQSRVLELWLAMGQNPSQEAVLKARSQGIRIRTVSRRRLDQVCSGGLHQGLAIRVSNSGAKNRKDFLSSLEEFKKSRAILLALDQIQDPHNLGAIARSAACLGACALLLPERRSAPLSPTALKSSAGALQKIPVFEIGNLAQTLSNLKDKGFWIYGADSSGQPAWSVHFNHPLVLVIGSEGEGMRPLVRSQCHALVAIPQSAQGVASLNVSCAASVLLYELARQAQKG